MPLIGMGCWSFTLRLLTIAIKTFFSGEVSQASQMSPMTMKLRTISITSFSDNTEESFDFSNI